MINEDIDLDNIDYTSEKIKMLELRVKELEEQLERLVDAVLAHVKKPHMPF